MDNINVKLLTGKMISNCKKIDDTILAVENDVLKLKRERNLLKEEVENLQKQISTTDNELSVNSEVYFELKRNKEKTYQKSVVELSKLESLNWKYKWHSIIADNYRAELKEQKERMEKLKSSKQKKDVCQSEVSTTEDDVIKCLTDENAAIEQEINLLERSLPKKDDIESMKKQISSLKDRNERILNQLKHQLAYVENHYFHTKTYLENLKSRTKK